MDENATLRAIRERRSVRNFTSTPVTDEQLEAILQAGRWAPSALNSQPWDFVIVRDEPLRSEIGDILRQATYAWRGFAAAPIMIVVSVDQTQDPAHFVEDGAIAAHNICLAAQSLGLGSSYAGVYAKRGGKGSVEGPLKALLGLPRNHRVIAVVPIGTARNAGHAVRRPLAEMVHHDRYESERAPRSKEIPLPAAEPEDTSHRLLREETRRRSPEEPGRFL